jgi:D-alanine--poly(phosphoribitol) ligase subunit 1
VDFLDRIDRIGRDAPHRVAHRVGARALTYGELIRRSDTLAARLAASLPDDGAPVAVVGHKEPEMLVAFLGCAKVGRAYVPLDVTIPPQRVERIVAAAGARLVLTPERVAELSQGDLTAPPVAGAGAATPLYVMFTSGSTGEPKGVVITRANVGHFLAWMQAEHGFGEGETFLDQAPYSFDLSVMSIYPCLTTGGTLASLTKDDVENPRRLFVALAASDVSVWVSTPSFAGMCLAEPRFGRLMLPRLRRFLFCGETLAPAIASQLLDRFPVAEVWNTYGPTEATVATTSVRVDRGLLAAGGSLPIGRPMPGTRVVIVDESLRELPAGERGEILIAGPNVSPGYLGRPDLTARAFVTWGGRQGYRTGDAGEVRDGLLHFAGRMDGQIKLHGYRIELGDVEAHLCALPEVRAASVVPMRAEDGAIVALSAFVVLRSRPSGSEFQVSLNLRRQLMERLPAYMLPRKFHLLESFPMTANGKVDRERLSEMVG